MAESTAFGLKWLEAVPGNDTYGPLQGLLCLLMSYPSHPTGRHLGLTGKYHQLE